jgi:hypothetical protein
LIFYRRHRILGLWGGPSDLDLNIKLINAFEPSGFGLRIGLGLGLGGLTGLRFADLC